MSNNKFIKNKKPRQIHKQKKKLLCWSDSVIAATGFGTVSKHILKALYDTGEWEIDQLAINYNGEFYDKKEVPYTLSPAKLQDPSNPYGDQMLVNSLLRKEYDALFVINDTPVVESVGQAIRKIRDVKAQKGHKPFAVVYYYPVDCRLLPEMTSMINAADRSVAYTNFAKESSNAVNIYPTDVIYHGSDIKSFYPIPPTQRTICRKKYFGADSDDTFVWINVGRNGVRKDLARSILAFSEFKKHIEPNSKMYVHAKIADSTGHGISLDMRVPISELGLRFGQEIIFPDKDFNYYKAYPLEKLNQLYSSADGFLTTNTGEGWGLCVTDAMCAGIPVVTPDHTTVPEILGEDRGYRVPCKEKVYIENSGYRPFARMDDLLAGMEQCYKDWKDGKAGLSTARSDMILKARAFTEQYSWENVCKQWVKLFRELKPKHNQFNGETV